MAVETLWLIKTPTGGNSRFVAVTDTDVPVVGAILKKKSGNSGAVPAGMLAEPMRS